DGSAIAQRHSQRATAHVERTAVEVVFCLRSRPTCGADKDKGVARDVVAERPAILNHPATAAILTNYHRVVETATDAEARTGLDDHRPAEVCITFSKVNGRAASADDRNVTRDDIGSTIDYVTKECIRAAQGQGAVACFGQRVCRSIHIASESQV